MKRENLKRNRGITLVALVITIIVLLILAGVTINLTLGENGIFTTAQQAAKNYTDAQNKELAELTDFTDGLTAGKVARTQDGVQYVGDGVGNLIPVPVGFSYLEGTRATGFVIKNDTDGNEFVWIPVGNVANYKRVAWAREDWERSQNTNGEDDTTKSTKITRADLDADTYYWTEKMPQDEYSSIETYGGFYIGRYEAGVKDYDEDNISISNSEITDATEKQNWTGYTGDNIKLVVQKGQQVWNYITRDRALTEATNLYNKTENNVTSKLCSSYTWDTALKFIETQNSTYPTNSTGGNYSVETGGTGELQKTGYHKVNNIYDMGGNTWEWTTEICSNSTTPCGVRGANFNSSALGNPAAGRGSYSIVRANLPISFRITLFM